MTEKLVRCPSQSPKYQRWHLPHRHLPRRHLPHRQNAWKWSCQWRSGFLRKTGLLSYCWVTFFAFIELGWICFNSWCLDVVWGSNLQTHSENVEPWSLKDVGQCLSSLLLYWFIYVEFATPPTNSKLNRHLRSIIKGFPISYQKRRWEWRCCLLQGEARYSIPMTSDT